MKKIILVMGIMMLLLSSTAMAATENRFENIKAIFVKNDDANKTQNMTQERLQAETTARYNAEMQATNQTRTMMRVNQSEMSEQAQQILEQLRVGERIQIKQQEKLFGLFNVERNIEYEKTAIGAQRVRKMFDFMFRLGGN